MHKGIVKVAIRSPGDEPQARKTEILEFRTSYGVLQHMARELRRRGVAHVVMEANGVYADSPTSTSSPVSRVRDAGLGIRLRVTPAAHSWGNTARASPSDVPPLGSEPNASKFKSAVAGPDLLIDRP